MIDKVLDDMDAIRKDMDNRWDEWFSFAVQTDRVAASVPKNISCWSQFHKNGHNNGPSTFFKRTIAIPVLDNLISELCKHLSDRKHVETFALLPLVMFNLQVFSERNLNLTYPIMAYS